MGYYCANYYAAPPCHNGVITFGDFCQNCIQTSRAFSESVFVKDDRPADHSNAGQDDDSGSASSAGTTTTQRKQQRNPHARGKSTKA